MQEVIRERMYSNDDNDGNSGEPVIASEGVVQNAIANETTGAFKPKEADSDLEAILVRDTNPDDV